MKGNRAGYARSPDNQRKRNRERYRADPAKVLARTKVNLARWQKANRARARLHNRHYLARLRGNGSPGVTPEEWQDILAACGYRCIYCDALGSLTIDHIVPVSKGGKDAPDNVAPACKSCNSSKGAKDLDTWLEEKFGI